MEAKVSAAIQIKALTQACLRAAGHSRIVEGKARIACTAVLLVVRVAKGAVAAIERGCCAIRARARIPICCRNKNKPFRLIIRCIYIKEFGAITRTINSRGHKRDAASAPNPGLGGWVLHDEHQAATNRASHTVENAVEPAI